MIGGFNSNELLPRLDWDLIPPPTPRSSGYSDITAVQNAILARAGVVTYSGPHWSSFDATSTDPAGWGEGGVNSVDR